MRMKLVGRGVMLTVLLVGTASAPMPADETGFTVRSDRCGVAVEVPVGWTEQQASHDALCFMLAHGGEGLAFIVAKGEPSASGKVEKLMDAYLEGHRNSLSESSLVVRQMMPVHGVVAEHAVVHGMIDSIPTTSLTWILSERDRAYYVSGIVNGEHVRSYPAISDLLDALVFERPLVRSEAR